MQREKLIAIGVEDWPEADKIDFSSAEEKKRYSARRTAFIRYAQGLKVKEAAKEAECSRAELYRLIKRSLKLDRYCVPYGHRILTKGCHVKEVRKNSESKKASKKPLPGAFSLLLKSHSKIKNTVDRLVKEKASFNKVCTAFKTACQDAGLQAPAYPFNCKSEGRTALRRYVHALEYEQERGKAQREGAWLDIAARAGGEDDFGPYRQGQLDGYWLDVDSEVEFEGREPGSLVRIPVTRIWILAMIERRSTACLGYALDFGENYSSEAVLAAVRNSTLPWKPRTSNSPIQYAAGDGFPSMHDELAYMCLDELHMDNANAHLSEMVRTTLHQRYRTVPMYGPVATPNERPQVEGAFSIWEKAGMADWKSAGRISYDVLHHAIDAWLAAYNNTRAPGSTRTRMETLRDMVSAGGSMNRRIPLKEREELQQYDLIDQATVGRSEKKHVVRWKNARYYGAILEKVKLGTELLIQANSKDPREILVSCCGTGQKLGKLLIERPWRTRAIDVRVRSWLGNDSSLRHLRSQGSNIIDALHAYIATKSRGAVQQRYKAAIALSFAPGSSSSALPPETAPSDTHTGKPQTSDAAPTNTRAAQAGSSRSSPFTKRRGVRVTDDSQAFVHDLLQNIGAL